MNKWTVHVADFGKIEKADVEVAPMTFFLGDNNSGKSYMMTLIYGLLHMRVFFDDYRFPMNSDAYKECYRFLDDILELEGEEYRTYVLNKQEIYWFQQLWNEILDLNRDRFLKNLFNREMQMGEFSLEFSTDTIYELKMKMIDDTRENERHMILSGKASDGKSLRGYGLTVEKMSVERMTARHFFLAYILEYMIRKDFEATGASSTSVYFPTARTGFLLTYKTLVGRAMQDKFNLKEQDKNLLTRPNSDFLTRLSSMTMQKYNTKYESIIQFVEDNVINGHIAVSDMPTHDIMYTPAGESKELPMFVSSGVVTELTPILLFLQYEDVGTMLIEEPEISLHPQLQWAMARALIRLKNAGIPIFATTHSDIILQHINNMLKLQGMVGKERFMEENGYEESDLLESDDVAVYQFDVKENQKTLVTKLSCGDYGFEAMTFYNTLEKLTQQIKQIENMEA